MPTFEKFETYDFDGTAVDLDAATGDSYEWKPSRPYLVVAATAVYSEATDGSIATPGAIAIDHTPSGGSRTEKATYTAEVSKAIGEEENMTMTDGNQFIVRDGDSVFLQHVTQQTSMEAGQLKVRLTMYAIPDGNI